MTNPNMQNRYREAMTGADLSPQPDRPEDMAGVVDDAVALKTSEKLLDYLRADVDRVTADIRVAEDRARGNTTLAAATIPILALLRTLRGDFHDLETAMALFVLILVLVVIALSAEIMWLRTTHRAEADWFRQRQDDAYHGRAAADYPSFLHELQSNWTSYLVRFGELRDEKYDALNRQNRVMLVMLAALSVLLILTIL